MLIEQVIRRVWFYGAFVRSSSLKFIATNKPSITKRDSQRTGALPRSTLKTLKKLQVRLTSVMPTNWKVTVRRTLRTYSIASVDSRSLGYSSSSLKKLPLETFPQSTL